MGPGLGRAGSPTTPSRPLRALTVRRRHRAPHPSAAAPARGRADPAAAGAAPRTGPPTSPAAGRCCPSVDADPTRRAHATAERLLERHGVVTRGAVMSERVAGGFAGGLQGALARSRTPAAAAAATSSRALGAAQFGTAGAVDRLRTFAELDGDRRHAKPDGGRPWRPPTRPTRTAPRCPWPERDDADGGHRPGRKAGALVVLVDGALSALRRARRPHPAHLDRRRRRCSPRRSRRSPTPSAAGAGPADGREGRRRADPRRRRRRRCARRSTAAGFVATPAG